MAITVKHKFVSAIPDAGDPTIVQPSNWNDSHDLVGTVPVANGGTGAATLTGYVKGSGTANMTAASTIPSTDITGLGTMSTQNSNNISVTGGTMSGVTISDYVATATKGVANGVASLDGSGTVPVSQLPAAVLGALSYQGTWNASTNSPTLTSSVGTKGYYYVVNVAGSTNLNGITDWQVGDWAVYNGSAWQKIDNTDAVTSVNGYTGTVVLTNTDISGFGTMSTQNANAVAITGGTINGTTIGATTATTGAFTTATASTSLTTPIVQASNSGGLSLKNSAGTTQISVGAGGGDNASINVSTNLNGTNAQIDISPTGTGHVHINPTGTGSVEIKPTNVGTMDNMTIGATTPKAITGTTITATTFSGSGANLTSIPNSALVNSAITINGTSTSLGGSISVGTVTSVTGTSPVVSSGGNTPAISMPAATSTVNGYLTSADWTTFNGKQPAGTYVTSVAATSPVTSSGGTTPTIAMPAATTSVSGYLTSTDWNTFNGKGNGTVTSVAQSFTGGLISVAGSPITSSGTLALTVAGTSGGIPYFSSASTWASSAVLAANALMVGGGAGVAPSTITTGTGVNTALGVNTGSIGAFVVNGGALGTPSSGTVTNLTGTASININGTVGATTATTGAFTTVSASGVITSTLATGTAPFTVASTTQVANLNAATAGTAGNVTGIVAGANGGTGVANTGSTITLGGSLTYSGAYTQTWTRTANTSLTLPVSGTVLSSVTAPANNPITGTPSSSNYLRGDGTWATVAASPAGSNTQVQYNSSGSFGASSTFTFDGTVQTAPVLNSSYGFILNPTTIATSYTIPSGYNATTAGKVTINTGITVTVSTGSRWVVV